MQHLSVLGSAAAEDGIDPPSPPGFLLSLYELAPSGPVDPQPGAHLGAHRGRRSGWPASACAQQPPMLPPLFHLLPAAATAAALLEVQPVLQSELGPTAGGRMPDLSRAWARWRLDLAAFSAAAHPPRQWLSQLLELAPLCL